MSLEALLDHKCDIYHLCKDKKNPGYGLPDSVEYSYSERPDIAGQVCHFGVKSQSVTVTQTAPANMMDAKTKLTLPTGTDIRMEDKVVDCDTGLEYTAEQPVNVRGHHLFVFVKKRKEQQPV